MDKIKSILDYLSVIKDFDVIFASLSTYFAYLFNCTWLFGIFIGILVLIVVYAILRRKMEKAGIRENRCELIPYLRFKVQNKKGKIESLMHKDLYHSLYKSKNILRQSIINNPEIEVESCDSQFGILLNSFHSFLYNVYKLDLTISVFKQYTDNDKIVLKRIFFCKSIAEKNMAKIRDPKKETVAPYFIKNINDKNKELDALPIDDIVKQAKNYSTETGRKIYKKNSAFDYVLSSNEQIWLSNNLNNDDFFSSSENYNEYYNSLVAVAIRHPIIENLDRKPIKGVLAFDSRKTNIFSKEECQHIMALMAHLLYELFEEFELKGTVFHGKQEAQSKGNQK